MNKRIKESLKKIKLIETIYLSIKRKILQLRIRSKGHLVLNAVNTALQDSGILYYADFGTLLGFVREKDFISHDPDIDVAVVVESKETINKIEKLLINANFKKFLTYMKEDEIVEEAYVLHGIKVDFFYVFPVSDTKVNSYSFFEENIDYTKPYNKTTKKFLFTRVHETIIFRNEKLNFPIPNNFEQVIIEKYGLDWQEPIKNWTPEVYDSIYDELTISKTRDGIQVRHF